MVEAARKEIETATGIPGADVMISRHARPHRAGARGPGRARGRLRRRAIRLAAEYRDGLPGKIAEAVRQADAALGPAEARPAHGQEASIAFNRRFHMTDGTVGWNPGKLNPKILKPAGTIDPDVAVVFFESRRRGASRSPTYVNYAVHLDNVGGLKFSADMPATLSRPARPVQGPGDGDGLHRRLLRRHQPHRRELGRAPGRLRERGADGR